MLVKEKIERIKEHFGALPTKEAFYQELMRLGKKLTDFKMEWKNEANRVVGCQSLMYLHCEKREGKLYFSACSDALISSGLASLLIEVYSNEPPDTLFIAPPTFLEELNLANLLSPSRANGLSSLLLKMKQAALQYLIQPAG